MLEDDIDEPYDGNKSVQKDKTLIVKRTKLIYNEKRCEVLNF